jgi:hypothetical protein
MGNSKLYWGDKRWLSKKIKETRESMGCMTGYNRKETEKCAERNPECYTKWKQWSVHIYVWGNNASQWNLPYETFNPRINVLLAPLEKS